MSSLLLLAPLASADVAAQDQIAATGESALEHKTAGDNNKAQTKAEKLRCRRIEPRGSNIKKRV